MKLFLFCAVSTVLIVAGCNGNPASVEESKSIKSDHQAAASSGEEHAHPTVGPHQGTLIELGKEEYHAELIHDAQQVTIYILDGSAIKAVPIDASELIINLAHDGKPSQYKLSPVPEAADPAGKSSRFSLQNAELVEELEHNHGNAKLSVMIGGKAYRGEIHHEDHAHQDHAGHE
ncbi:hypothetical protein SH467x_003983 [Pirellulaceae bacterium SH467]